MTPSIGLLRRSRSARIDRDVAFEAVQAITVAIDAFDVLTNPPYGR
jgi:hypothetical protein